MATIIVRDIPEEAYANLKRLAESHNRSVAAEVRALIQNTMTWEDRARALQARLEGRHLTPSLELIREGRDDRG
jgi:plasmid stability protein